MSTGGGGRRAGDARVYPPPRFFLLFFWGGRGSTWEGGSLLLAWSSAKEGAGRDALRAGKLCCSRSVLPSPGLLGLCFIFLFIFFSLSGGGKAEREVAARSFLDI